MEQPNILCISVDSLRADSCSFINSELETTPYLKNLAQDSAVFDRCISPSVWTLQSHASVFTGLYPPEHQLNGGQTLLGNHPTLSQLLSDRGYETKSFYYNGWLGHSEILRSSEQLTTAPVADGFHIPYLTKIRDIGRRLLFMNKWRDDTTIRNAIHEIEKENEPFYYFIHLNDTHHKYSPPRPYHKKFSQRSEFELAWNLFQQKKLFDNRPEIYAGLIEPTNQVLEVMRELYYGCIARADMLLNILIEKLGELSLLENTVVIIFGDHGDCFGEDGLVGHQFSVSDGLIRVPLIIKDPTNTVLPGKYNELIQLNDIYPTILDIVGVDRPDTNSISAINEREYAYVYYSAPVPFVQMIENELDGQQIPPKKQYCIWESPNQKLIWYPDSDNYREFGTDTSELKKILNEHYNSLTPIRTKTRSEVAEDVRNNLREMGYL